MLWECYGIRVSHAKTMEPLPEDTAVSAAPVSGPVTTAFKILRRPYSPAAMTALRYWPVLPVVFLLRPALAHAPQFGAYAGQVLGGDALLCLVACLTITPLMSVARVNVARLRGWYGVWVFTIGVTGLLYALVTTTGPLAGRIAGSAAIWTGLAIVMIALPLTVTSNRQSQQWLGREWKRWQRVLSWAVWAMVFTHLLALHAWQYAAAMAAVTVPLVLLRLPSFRQRVKAWRADGYSDGRMWAAMDTAALLYAAGLTVLIAQEVLAIVRATTLAGGA